MPVQDGFSLKRYNTFSIDAHAEDLETFHSVDELRLALLRAEGRPVLILGGGSNVLFVRDFDGTVLHNDIQGVEVVREDKDHVYLKAGGGVNWHYFVLQAIDRGLGGVENLSLIPGTVGASPIQNIGAYGVELKDTFEELEALSLETHEMKTFKRTDCAFGYRDSVFKRSLRNKYVITSVTFRLQKNPLIQTTYGAIKEELARMLVAEPDIRDVSNAVINIRRSKLPDPAVIGNAGSFFKNPEVSEAFFSRLKSAYPAVPGYQVHGGVKLAAGWLIEQCGWKGFRRGDAGCHALQALVLVNYGNAAGEEIFQLSTEILNSVREKFGVELEREVNIL